MNKIVLVLGVIIAIFAASNVVRSFQDYSAAQVLYESTTDALMAELTPDQIGVGHRPDRPWPPRRGYYEDAGRSRDNTAQLVIKETPDDPLALCDENLKANIIGRFTVYFSKKMEAIRYPLRAAGEWHARAAERDWVTSTTTEAEARIVAILKSGQIRVRDLRREHFSEARRLLGADDPSAMECPPKPRG